MSSHHNETIICPNCGFEASRNYCAQCGQENHLHKDTFRGLVMHFIGHYFHYDSKFWMTMKALWFHPGRLTKAYWDKQRMRYIPPISLYIFISAIFFLTVHIVMDYQYSKPTSAAGYLASLKGRPIDSVKYKELVKDSLEEADAIKTSETATEKIGVPKKIFEKDKDDPDTKENLDRTMHTLSIILFFMIPVVAGIMKILFFKKRELGIVQHTIFALHTQSFFFSLFFLLTINPLNFLDVPSWLGSAVNWTTFAIFLVVPSVYMVASLRSVYKAGWVKAIAYTIIIYIGYAVCMLLVAMLFSIAMAMKKKYLW